MSYYARDIEPGTVVGAGRDAIRVERCGRCSGDGEIMSFHSGLHQCPE